MHERLAGLVRFEEEPDLELHQCVARGGSGEVWKAWDRRLRRWVAAKRTTVSLRKLEREAQAAARLSHPNIVPIYRVSDRWIVMPFIEGRTLAEVRLSARRAAEAVRDAALAVHHAHRRGVIHRDLKPGNLMMDVEGRVWVLDFGLAWCTDQTATAGVTGTPGYMSPEQASGSAVDARSDVYALGATLYHLLVGRPPFEGASFAEIVRKVIEADATVPSHVPGELRAIVLKAMEKDPGRRYQSAAELAADLQRWLGGEPVVARPSSRVVRRLRRHAGKLVLSAIVGIIAGAGFAERQRALETMRQTAATSLQTALRLRRQGHVDAMRALLAPMEAAYRAAPGTAEVEYLMGRMHRALMNEARALEHYERALARDPGLQPARYERLVLRAKRYVRERQRGHTDESLGRAIREDASAVSHPAARGIVLFVEGRYAEAQQELQAAVQRDPLAEDAWELLAQAAYAQAYWEARADQWLQAEEAFSRALEHDRGYLPLWLGRGDVRFRRGDLDGAEADFTEALRLDPACVDALLYRAVVRSHRAIQHRRAEDWNGAEADYRKASELQPARAEIQKWLRDVQTNRTLMAQARPSRPTATFH